MTQFLRREERLEDARLVLKRDADPRIAHFNQHIIARRHDLVAAALIGIAGDVGCLDRQRAAAFRHRVARIDRQIDNHLFKLSLIDLDQPELAGVLDLQLDILADQAAQQMRELGQHVGDGEDARLQGLLAREGQ